jgi:hypothetical protein
MLGLALVCGLAAAVAAGGCAKKIRKEDTPSSSVAAAPVVPARLPVEDAIVLAKDRLSETSGQWRVESVQRVPGGWDIRFASAAGPADFGGNCVARVTDDRRCHLTPN